MYVYVFLASAQHGDRDYTTIAPYFVKYILPPGPDNIRPVVLALRY